MRGTVAKRLRRVAQKFATDTGRTENKIRTIDHGPVVQMVPDEELNLNGTFRYIPIRFDRLQDVLVDGPRFFLKRLKQAHRLGLLAKAE